MVRAPFFDTHGVKKGAWSPEEDEKLRSYIEKYGHWNWRELPKFAGLQRCGKSCRLRWMNYLRPEVKHGNYTKEEDELILKLHEEYGNRWSMIASKLPGRTDNEIKNHWNTNLKKRAAESRKAHSGESFQSDAAGVSESEVESAALAELTPPHLILESSPLSPATTSSTSEFSESWNYDNRPVMRISTSSEIYEGSNGDFWTEPFVADSNFGYDQSSPYSLRAGCQVPYDLFHDDTVDLFYQLMQDFPES